MDDHRFDELTRFFARPTSRRRLAQGLAGIVSGGALAALGRRPTAAVTNHGCHTNFECGYCQLCQIRPGQTTGHCVGGGNEGLVCQGECGSCHNGRCEADSSLCETCARCSAHTFTCVSTCEHGAVCCDNECCAAGQTCCYGGCCDGPCAADGSCCPSGELCNGDCCGDGEACCGGTCKPEDQCCPSNQFACYGNCCDAIDVCCSDGCCGTFCAADGNCCPSAQACGLHNCCPAGTVCCPDFTCKPADQCCPKAQVCGEQCCQAGETCCNFACYNAACPTGQVFNQTTCKCECPNDTTLCGEQCCTGDQTCCGTSCVALCDNGCNHNPTTCACDTPPGGMAYCTQSNTCVDNTCPDGQVFNQATCQCECGAGTTKCGDTCCTGDQACCSDGSCQATCNGGCDATSFVCQLSDQMAICCPNGSQCCPGNFLYHCGPSPQSGLCCQQGENECEDRCCGAGTLCQSSIVNGRPTPTCCPGDVAPCNGGCCSSPDELCDSCDGVHYQCHLPGQPYC